MGSDSTQSITGDRSQLDLFKAGKPMVRSVEFPETGAVLYVRQLPGTAIDLMARLAENAKSNGKARFTVNDMVELCMMSLCDSNGVIVCTEKDRKWLSNTPYAWLERIMGAITILNFGGEKKSEELSGETGIGDSHTDSL